MKERIKQYRKMRGLSQEEFGEKVGVSRAVIANIELGRVEPTDIFIKHLCQIYPISETWLRTGTGDIESASSADEQIAAYVAEVLNDAPDSFRRRLLTAQASWTPEMWEALEKICESLK